MPQLKSRIARLERLDAPSPVALVWVDYDETREQALARRFGDSPRPEHVMFIGWTRAPEGPTQDPTRDKAR